MERTASSRRAFVAGAIAAGGGAILGCSREDRAHGQAPPRGEEAEITPGEDLMREHGVLQRILVVWSEADAPLRRGERVDLDALKSSVGLVQRFIEGYHERLEEELVFPRLERAGRERALVRTLRAQHEVGRTITAEVARLLSGSLDPRSRERVADRLADYRRMYLAHAAREDTVVFPALQRIVGPSYAELGEDFERREHAILGEGGFESAVSEAGQIERAFGLDDLARFTPRRSPA